MFAVVNITWQLMELIDEWTELQLSYKIVESQEQNKRLDYFLKMKDNCFINETLAHGD